MSHILDALRRAEDERRLGKPPDRGMIAGPLRSATTRRGGWRWVLALGALLLAVTAIFLAYRQLEPQPTVVAPQAPPEPVRSPPPVIVAERPAAPPESVAEAPAEPELPRARVGDAEGIESLDALFPAETAAPEDRASAENSSPALKTRDVFRTASENKVEAAVQPSAPDDSADLPSARSAGMPEFTIQVHAWAPEAEERFIRVDGRRLQEGDSLPNGARIARIARDGLILEWRGQRLMQRLGR